MLDLASLNSLLLFYLTDFGTFRKAAIKMYLHPVVYACVATLLMFRTCDSHGNHDDEFDPDAPPENRLNRDGFINNKE